MYFSLFRRSIDNLTARGEKGGKQSSVSQRQVIRDKGYKASPELAAKCFIGETTAVAGGGDAEIQFLLMSLQRHNLFFFALPRGHLDRFCKQNV